ncbi:methyltransferase [Vibrio paracholerae]|nr:methyltransferase [Vibrio paracholerae]
MAHDWDEYAANWEKDPATHAFAQSVFEHLTKILSLQGKHILDFGWYRLAKSADVTACS